MFQRDFSNFDWECLIILQCCLKSSCTIIQGLVDKFGIPKKEKIYAISRWKVPLWKFAKEENTCGDRAEKNDC